MHTFIMNDLTYHVTYDRHVLTGDIKPVAYVLLYNFIELIFNFFAFFNALKKYLHLLSQRLLMPMIRYSCIYNVLLNYYYN